MRVACENCKTVYESTASDAASVICPYCQHANRPRSAVEESTRDEHDPLKTMVFGVGEVSAESGSAAASASALPAGARLELAVVREGQPPECHPIGARRITVGRGLCDIRLLDDPEVSREHCSIERVEGKIVLEDLQSANGTLVNGKLVREQVLCDGDEIQVGSTCLRFRVIGPD